MSSQIRPNRQEVSDRFPMLGFTIRTDGESKRYEVAIAVDSTLFQPDAKSRRTMSNFYSSRAGGLQPIDRGEAVYVLPPDVLSRFVGNEKLFYALATYSNGDTAPELSSVPSGMSPYISLRSLSGRSLKRIGILPSRQRAASSYGGGNELEWAGDTAMPGTQPAAPTPAPTNGKPNGQAQAPAAAAAAFEYRDGFGPLPPTQSRRVSSRAQSNESYTLNWDDVELIPQPNEYTCWATAGAMVIGWRDQVCLTPETVAQICGRSTTSGLSQDDRRRFASEIGLIAEQPQSYTPDGFRSLLENYGPLWVSVQLPGSGHAIVVSGMYSDGAADGSDTYVRISDPWDRVVGSPGSPGGYLDTHNSGSRYIMSWADFTAEYEARASTAPDGTVNAQVLHAPSASGRQPNRSGAAGYAMAATYMARARAMTGSSPDTNWADVELIAGGQNSSWSAALSMVVGWRDRVCIDPVVIESRVTDPNSRASFAAAWDLTIQHAASYTALELANMLHTYGPLWVAGRPETDQHAFVIVQICGDGTADGTIVCIKDPWGQATGSPRAPITNPTPGLGSTYSICYRELAAQYPPSSASDTHADVQLIHSRSIGNHTSSPIDCSLPAAISVPQSWRATARAQSGQSFSLNWDEVQSIAQPTDVSCWATAAAMVLGWRDRMSLTPETVASISGRTTATGLDPAQGGQFASEIGLTYEHPQSYTIDGFRQMLEAHGPLWVGAAVPGLHAIVVTGMYSDGAADGSDTYLRITDPWDRVTGSPGSPGDYLNSHSTGSRYILSWAQFVAEYEGATRFDQVNLQVLHAADNGGRQPSTTGGVGYAMSAASAKSTLRRSTQPTVRAQSTGSFSLNWDQVEMIPQPTNLSCWATAAAMVIGWRDQICLTPETVGEVCGRNLANALLTDHFRAFAGEIGLTAAPPQCYTPEGLHTLLENYGPVWVGIQTPEFGHAVVVTGMYSGGAPDGSDTYVRITDPMDRVVGTPGAPGNYPYTHDTGSRYIMSWAQFTAEYEGFATSTAEGTVNAQILHSPSAAGRQPNRSGAAGYAMSLGNNGGRTARPMPPPPKQKSQAMNAPAAAVSTIAGAVIERIVNHDGNITWTLEQLRGLKHPNDVAPASPAVFRDGPTIRLDNWPYVDALTSDRISAWFSVDWQYNDRSLGNVQISNIGTNGALLQGLQVDAKIMDDNIVYPHESPRYAALRIRFNYRFTRAIGSDWIAITDLHLYGDGTYETSSRWVQD